MDKMILNDTPVRTSVNFGINNISVKEIKLPQNLEKFKNFNLINETENIDVSYNSTLAEDKFTYGVGKDIQALEKNSKVRVRLKESKKNEKIFLKYNLNEKEDSLSNYVKVEAKENSNGSVIIKYNSEDKSTHLAIESIKIDAAINSNVQIVILNMLNENSTNLLSVEATIEENAIVNVIIIDFGGKTSISNYYSNLIGKNAKNALDTIYLGDQERLIDLNYISHLRGEKTDTNIEVQGALKDKATKNFKGTIDFKRGCSGAKGNENEFCMLLSDTAKSKALPMLLCTEDDVEGNHATASGKVDKNELFYLMTRGISQKEAMKLIVRARFTPIIEKIEVEEIKKQIVDKIDEKLN